MRGARLDRRGARCCAGDARWMVVPFGTRAARQRHAPAPTCRLAGRARRAGAPWSLRADRHRPRGRLHLADAACAGQLRLSCGAAADARVSLGPHRRGAAARSSSSCGATG
ncbi:MAG: hypothetical protein MZW92_56030 [Comamonadaceae bacterium]|nr:hypothetical protein [Comamonadaceae bacterium]